MAFIEYFHSNPYLLPLDPGPSQNDLGNLDVQVNNVKRFAFYKGRGGST